MNKSLKFFAGLLASIFVVNASAQTPQDGLKALDAEQYTKAAGIFETLAKTQPTADNLYYLGYYYLQTDQADKAKDAFAKSEAADPASPWGSLAKGTFALYQNKKTDAKAAFDNAIKITKGKKADVLYRIGEAYTYFPADEKQRDIARAVEVLNMAAKIDAKNPEILSTLGDAYIIPNDGSNAVMNYEAAIRLNPKSARSYVKSANVLIRARNYTEALNTYKKAIEAEPSYAPAYRQIADLYYRAGQYPQAVSALQKYIDLSENKNEAKFQLSKTLYLLARNLQDDRKTAEAKEAFKQTAQLLNELQQSNPNLDPVSNRMLGISQAEIGETTEGLKNMEILFQKMDPKKIQTIDYKYLAKLQAANKQDSLSILTLEKAMELDTADYDLYAQSAKSYIVLKKYDKAAEQYKKMIAKKGDKTTGGDYFTLGRTYYFAQKLTEADTTLSLAYDKYSTPVNVQGQLTTLIYKARTKSLLDFQENKNDKKWVAAPYYEKYISIVNESVKEEDKGTYKANVSEAYYQLGGREFQKNKNIAKSKEYLAKALELDPNNKQAQEFLKQLNAPPPPPRPAQKPTTQKPGAKPNGK